ncbi:hypothetical protein BDF19DRAFT_455013 [Syncephalis fuscata]|nr:hypothetical protein BDF19DRAFT_455013 [Syncephalis fuscata]
MTYVGKIVKRHSNRNGNIIIKILIIFNIYWPSARILITINHNDATIYFVIIAISFIAGVACVLTYVSTAVC